MSEIILLDGGMGQELVHRAGDQPTPLWATQIMIDHPRMVQQVHADYFAAGATIATTNTYAIHHDRLTQAGLDSQFLALHHSALAAAKAARDTHGSGRIAGAIGPLVTSYRPDTHPPHEVAVRRYAEVAQILAPEVDLILCESVASLAQARAVVQGASAAGLPIWLSVTVDDTNGARLRSGERAAEVCTIARHEGAAALLANCSAPEAMARAMDAIGQCDLPFGAYANAFQQFTNEFLKGEPAPDTPSAQRDLGPRNYAAFAMGWADQGATILGGCCEVGPAHIAQLARALVAAGHRIV